MPKVFISHDTRDKTDVESQIVTLLNRFNIETWIDNEGIRAGDDWERRIQEELRNCDWFLVALSPRSIQSNWVKAEMLWAFDERPGRIIPVILEPCDPSQLHLQLKRLQYVDFANDKARAQRQLLSVWGVMTRTVSSMSDITTDDDDITLDSCKVRPGSQIDRYLIKRRLSVGGYGNVFLAEDTLLGRPVVVKVPDSADPRYVKKLQVEARFQAQLHISGVVTIHDVGQWYLVQEYITGRSFESLMHDAQLTKLISILADFAAILVKVHWQGVVHRDIKPTNILVDTDDAPHILDFGIALKIGASNPNKRVSSLGTSAYMAPEAFLQPEKIDCRTDIWSFGVVLYEALTGRQPFSGTTFEIIQAVLSNVPIRPSKVTKVPRELEAICVKCLAMEPKDRFSSAAELEDALRSWLANPSPWLSNAAMCEEKST